MINLNNYIVEKLRIDKNIKLSKQSDIYYIIAGGSVAQYLEENYSDRKIISGVHSFTLFPLNKSEIDELTDKHPYVWHDKIAIIYKLKDKYNHKKFEEKYKSGIWELYDKCDKIKYEDIQ